MTPEPVIIPAFMSISLALVVYLGGVQLTRSVAFLRDFNIPEPVSGGLAAAAFTMIVFLISDRQLTFDLEARDYLLVVFFAGIGLNARISDLIRGGVPLLLLLLLTLAFLFIQNFIGMGIAILFDQPRELSVLMGSAALIGGHGTALAWSPKIAEATGAAGVEELGIAVATLGLVAAALIGGPIAKYLIEGKKLTPENEDLELTVGIRHEDEQEVSITHVSLIRTILVLHIAIFFGTVLQELLADMGLQLPVFVPCLLVGIIIGNLMPMLLPGIPEVRATPTLALISDFSLGLFLAMSLMSLQLWQLAGMGKLLTATLGAQTLVTLIFVLFVVFPVMGRNYRAAVLSAGFGGFALGATPTAIANMTAVTKNYGPSPVAFIILPLVSAFFVDIANAVVIQLFLPS